MLVAGRSELAPPPKPKPLRPHRLSRASSRRSNDVKPANFCMGLNGATKHRLHLVDFGLSAPLPQLLPPPSPPPSARLPQPAASPSPLAQPSSSTTSRQRSSEAVSAPAGTPLFASVAHQLGEATRESDDVFR